MRDWQHQEHHEGLAVWAGLDPFGTNVVSRLTRWTTPDGDSHHLGGGANRTLPHLLVSPDNQDLNKQATAEIMEAIGQLLAGPIAQAALHHGRDNLLVVHVWLVVDVESTAFIALESWVLDLLRELQGGGVQAKLYLLVRHRFWLRPDAAKRLALRQMRSLIEEVCLPGQIGEGKVAIFVVSDRNSLGGRYQEDQLDAVAYRFADMLFLGGIDYSDLARMFPDLALPGNDRWDELPAFGSFSTEAVHWDDPERRRLTNAESRRRQLNQELSAPVPRTFSPDVPVTPHLSIDDHVNWFESNLAAPRWTPHLWNSSRQGFASSQERLNRWLAEAKQWRRNVLRIHKGGQSYLAQQARAERREYATNLDDVTRTMLIDDSVPGFFAPMERLLEEARNDLHVVKNDLPPITPPDPDFDASTAIVKPAEELKGADQRLISRLEHKINPWLLTFVSVLSFIMLWGWTVYAAKVINEWRQPLQRVIGGSSASLKERLQSKTFDILPGLQDFLPTTWQVALYAGVIYLVVIGLIVLRITRLQRVALEQAWAQHVSSRAQLWTQSTIATLDEDLRATETRLMHDLVDAASDEIDERVGRLRQLKDQCQHPIAGPTQIDPAISWTYPEEVPDPEALTESQIMELLAQFRAARSADPALTGPPKVVFDTMLQEAAKLVGDPVPDLQYQLQANAELRDRVLSLPTPQSVYIPPLDPTVLEPMVRVDEGRVSQYLAVPSTLASVIRNDIDDQTVHLGELPVPDRFYQATVKSQLTARRIWGQSALRASTDVSVDELVAQQEASRPKSDPKPEPEMVFADGAEQDGPVPDAEEDAASAPEPSANGEDDDMTATVVGDESAMEVE